MISNISLSWHGWWSSFDDSPQSLLINGRHLIDGCYLPRLILSGLVNIWYLPGMEVTPAFRSPRPSLTSHLTSRWNHLGHHVLHSKCVKNFLQCCPFHDYPLSQSASPEHYRSRRHRYSSPKSKPYVHRGVHRYLLLFTFPLICICEWFWLYLVLMIIPWHQNIFVNPALFSPFHQFQLKVNYGWREVPTIPKTCK